MFVCIFVFFKYIRIFKKYLILFNFFFFLGFGYEVEIFCFEGYEWIYVKIVGKIVIRVRCI